MAAVAAPAFSKTMKLTEHFYLKEFVNVNDPWAWGHIEKNWAKFYPRLLKLCGVLEKIRAHFGGRALDITSGVRSPAHNARIGGAKASQHVEATAADFHIDGVAMEAIVTFAGTLKDVGGLAIKPGSFVHTDVRARWLGRIVRWTY